MFEFISPNKLLNEINTKNKLYSKIKSMIKIEENKEIEIKNYLNNKNFTEFEIQQLIILKPRTILCLQIIIEDMDQRFSTEDLNKILKVIN